MKIQFLNGGLANQAFQYIFARHYELSHPGECMYLDDSYFALHTVHNGYELEKVFGIKPHMLSECFDEEVWQYILSQRQEGKSIPTILCENGIDTYMISEVGNTYKNFNPFEGKVVEVPCNIYDPVVFGAPGNTYYHGYWINKEWFAKYRETFLKEFSFPPILDEQNKEYEKRIQEGNSVSLHIRRGDYVSLGVAFDTAVYERMTKTFEETLQERKQTAKGWEIFVFSDDVDWCRKNAESLGLNCFRDIIFVEGNIKGKNYIDLQLMSRCKAMMMSNSAFCYLAALLNTRREIVINPTTRQI